MYIIESIHPEGLGGGTILSGSISASFSNAFWYYPIIASTANVKFGNMTNAFNQSITFTAGVGVKGVITQVTQSAGLAIVYNTNVDAIYPSAISGSGPKPYLNPAFDIEINPQITASYVYGLGYYHPGLGY